jgi:NADPH:quinone reductase-like Zn-dependent oxidoreductase
MKAVLLTGDGGPEMLRYGDAQDPVAGAGEIVVDAQCRKRQRGRLQGP